MEARQSTGNSHDYYNFPPPTNIELYNAGYKPGHEIRPVFRAPMELPHVLILPQASCTLERHHDGNEEMSNSAYDGNSTATGSNSTGTKINLPKLKAQDGLSFVPDSQHLNSCSDGRCWPYLE